jgi:hypothetical protein
LQAWRERYPDRALEHAWFFFDEVQAAPAGGLNQNYIILMQKNKKV